MKQCGPLLACILSLYGTIAYSQKVEFLRDPVVPARRVGGTAPFHFVEDGLDTTLLSYVASVKVSAPDKPSVLALYRTLKSTSRKIGANAFRLLRFDPSGVAITADLYFITDDMVDNNNMLKPKNTIYVFAGDFYQKTSTNDAFEFNGTVQNLRNGTFFVYSLQEGEKAKLKKGTVTGTTMWITWKPNQLPAYYSIRELDKKTVAKRNNASRPAKPGRFTKLEPALGALLGTVVSSQ